MVIFLEKWSIFILFHPTKRLFINKFLCLRKYAYVLIISLLIYVEIDEILHPLQYLRPEAKRYVVKYYFKLITINNRIYGCHLCLRADAYLSKYSAAWLLLPKRYKSCVRRNNAENK